MSGLVSFDVLNTVFDWVRMDSAGHLGGALMGGMWYLLKMRGF